MKKTRFAIFFARCSIEKLAIIPCRIMQNDIFDQVASRRCFGEKAFFFSLSLAVKCNPVCPWNAFVIESSLSSSLDYSFHWMKGTLEPIRSSTHYDSKTRGKDMPHAGMAKSISCAAGNRMLYGSVRSIYLCVTCFETSWPITSLRYKIQKRFVDAPARLRLRKHRAKNSTRVSFWPITKTRRLFLSHCENAKIFFSINILLLYYWSSISSLLNMSSIGTFWNTTNFIDLSIRAITEWLVVEGKWTSESKSHEKHPCLIVRSHYHTDQVRRNPVKKKHLKWSGESSTDCFTSWKRLCSIMVMMMTTSSN